MSNNIALNTEIARVKKVIDKLEVEVRTAEYERELERELALHARISERTKYLTLLYKEKHRLFYQGKSKCT